jgi:hypothetical protein
MRRLRTQTTTGIPQAKQWILVGLEYPSTKNDLETISSLPLQSTRLNRDSFREPQEYDHARLGTWEQL